MSLLILLKFVFYYLRCLVIRKELNAEQSEQIEFEYPNEREKKNERVKKNQISKVYWKVHYLRRIRAVPIVRQ